VKPLSLRPFLQTVHIPEGRTFKTVVLSEYFDAPQGKYTQVGWLLKQAKYQSNERAMGQLEVSVSSWLGCLGDAQARNYGLAGISMTMAIPSNPLKVLSVPHRTAAAVAHALKVEDRSIAIKKQKATPPAKVNSVFQPETYATKGDLSGATVLLVDDVFRSGNTLSSVASVLLESGANSVLGLCIARANKGITLGN
jgi:hypothetical protein